MRSFHGFRPRRAFTLLELLVVLAIIGILAAILIPTVGAARVSARRAETKVRFSQWATALEAFKQEYGYYPTIDGTTAHKIDPEYFAGALSGRKLDGTAFDTTDDAKLCGNKRRIAFYVVAENEVSADRARLLDPFGNSDLAVYFDTNGDGRITVADAAVSSPPVSVGPTGAAGWAPPTSDLDFNESAGVRAGVIFYSAGRGANDGDLVLSWK